MVCGQKLGLPMGCVRLLEQNFPSTEEEDPVGEFWVLLEVQEQVEEA